MERSFVSTPYVETYAPSSRPIQLLLDAEQAEYIEWRSRRKPVRHAFVTSKINAPLKRPSSIPLLQDQSNNTANHCRSETDPITPIESLQLRKTALTPLTSPAVRLKPCAFSTSMDSHVDVQECATPARRRVAGNPKAHAAKKKLQRYLYDFHASVTFALTSDPDEEHEATSTHHSSLTRPPPPAHEPSCDAADIARSDPSEDAEAEASPVAPAASTAPTADLENAFILDGLPIVTPDVFEAVFEHDWHASDAERMIRDAVERQRIHAVLRKTYRVVLLFFRAFAGKTAVTRPDVASMDAAAILQVPSRVALLADLNVPCVDAGKFGLSDAAPLRRDGVVGFLLSVARMLATHPANPLQFRQVVAEGIELSEAMKILVYRHVVPFAQAQDPNHFRNVFLRKTAAASDRMAVHADVALSISALLAAQDAMLHAFFNDVIAANPTRSSSRPEPALVTGPAAQATAAAPTTATTTTAASPPAMSFPAFLAALNALSLVAKRRPPTTPGNRAALLDRNRAVRIFLSCLAISVDFDGGVATQQLTFVQFLEALLRIALLWREDSICRGGFDVCPSQVASEPCPCLGNHSTSDASYDLQAFYASIADVLSLVQAARVQRTKSRAVMKMASLRMLQALASPS